MIETTSIKFISVNEALPETHGNAKSAFIKAERDGTEKITKGMFYMNGGKPTFAAYGSTVEGVKAWAYR